MFRLHCDLMFVFSSLAILATAWSLGAELPQPCSDTNNPEQVEQIELLRRKALDSGDANAQHELGRRYFYGCGLEWDTSEAKEWFLLAAGQGLADAQFNLGVMYLRGWGVEPDGSEAKEWFLLAADQGLADAQFNLGVMYLRGMGVEPDGSEAKEWFLLAANQGLKDAQFNLGKLYMEGRGVRGSESEALKWYEKAAKQRHPQAAYNIAILLARGPNQSGRKLMQAHSWFNYADDLGYDDADTERRLLESLMTTGEIERAGEHYRIHRTPIGP